MKTQLYPSSGDIKLRNPELAKRYAPPGSMNRLIINSITQGRPIGIHVTEGENPAITVIAIGVAAAYSMMALDDIVEPRPFCPEDMESLSMETKGTDANIDAVVAHVHKEGIDMVTGETMIPMVGPVIFLTITKNIDACLEYLSRFNPHIEL